jgi:hypothetical protein
MKNCKKCNLEFEPVKGLLNYCSISCRNSREWSDDDKLKKSISAKNSDKVRENNKNRPNDFWLKISKKRNNKI